MNLVCGNLFLRSPLAKVHKNIPQRHLQTGISFGHCGHYRRPRRKYLIRCATSIKIS